MTGQEAARSGEQVATCGCPIGGLHRYACAGVGHVHPPRRSGETDWKREAETHRESAESMTGLWQAERERADRLEAMCDRLAERLVMLPDLWREEGRAVMRNAAGEDLTPQQRVGKWLHDKTITPPGKPTGGDAG